VLTRYCVVPHVGLYYGTLPANTKHITVTNLSDEDLPISADGRPIFTVSARAQSSRPAAGYHQLSGPCPFRLETDSERPDGPSI
jgi:hypothetical protein